jgi:hypothetical protein
MNPPASQRDESQISNLWKIACRKFPILGNPGAKPLPEFPATNENEQTFFRRAFWIVLAVSTLLRLLVAGRFGFSVDESHYVLFARRLAWGYFDHPPFVAFLGALTTLAGRSVFLYRLGPILCSAASIVILRKLALALYRDERVAFFAQALLLLMPMGHLISVALLPDAPLNVFWCAAMLASWRAIQSDRWRDWLLMGVLFGCALMSKYHGVLIPLCLACYVIASPVTRKVLCTPKPYVAGLVGILVFLPNILWNARHGWISYAFQLQHGHGKHAAFKIAKILNAFGGQFAAASPVIFGLLVAMFIVLARAKPAREEDRFVLWTSLPVFVFFLYMGLKGAILPHWTFVGWWTGSIGLAAVLLRKIYAGENPHTAMRWRKWTKAAAISSLVLIALMYAAILLPIVPTAYPLASRIVAKLHARFPAIHELGPFKTKFDPTNDLYGWDEIGRGVEDVKKKMPQPEKTFVFCQLFYTVSQTSDYLDDSTESTTLMTRKNQYSLWFNPTNHIGWDALLVDEDRVPDPKIYAPLFREIETEPTTIVVKRHGETAHTIRVFRCLGYSGGLLN